MGQPISRRPCDLDRSIQNDNGVEGLSATGQITSPLRRVRISGKSSI